MCSISFDKPSLSPDVMVYLDTEIRDKEIHILYDCSSLYTAHMLSIPSSPVRVVHEQGTEAEAILKRHQLILANKTAVKNERKGGCRERRLFIYAQ